jgi:hypothetical protein
MTIVAATLSFLFINVHQYEETSISYEMFQMVVVLSSFQTRKVFWITPVL